MDHGQVLYLFSCTLVFASPSCFREQACVHLVRPNSWHGSNRFIYPKVAWVAVGPDQPFFFACAAKVLELSRPAEGFWSVF